MRWWCWALLVLLPFVLLGLAVGRGAGPALLATGLAAAAGTFVAGTAVQYTRARLLWRQLRPELDALIRRVAARG